MLVRSSADYIKHAYRSAIPFLGDTIPNPAVGAVLVKGGVVIGRGAHRGAGLPHAEIEAINSVENKSLLKDSTLYVTLEPCNHTGKTPPCTKAILENGIIKVVYSQKDINPQVTGKGHEFLVQNGIEVEHCEVPLTRRLVDGFFSTVTRKKPWVVLKCAFRHLGEDSWTMIPENAGFNRSKRTFTRKDSLVRAHLERKWADAIVTTPATVEIDRPRLNVREVPQNSVKTKQVFIISRKKGYTPPKEWLEEQRSVGNQVTVFQSFEESLNFLYNSGGQRVLIEAGPTFSEFIEKNKLCDEKLFIYSDAQKDVIEEERV
jgi:diaminohydroxyphosphoribosylaminopyrimidine deaminase/5-amino-6-(5-phosphoribosylamino)uracil reductase